MPAQVVYYPQPESSDDRRASYPAAVLRLCEQYLEQQYQFKPSAVHAQQSRNLLLLQQGRGLDVVWTVSNAERERQLLPVRIPLDRGLIGWRLLLIRQQDAQRFADISSLPQLAAMIGGQGHDWPDVEVLRANGLNLSTSTTYQGLFDMLARGHIEYFPRSVAEIWPESSAHSHKGLVVDPTLALHYPGLLYFFVNRQNTQLAEALTSCLQQATEDGSLQQLFYTYYGFAIKLAALGQRQILTLALPEQSVAVPELDDRYWFTPGESIP